MKDFFKKNIVRIKNKFLSIKQEWLLRSREKASKNLIKNKKTDYNRWKNNSELHKNWNDRTTILASYVSPSSKIIEFGAGNMFLKELLNPNHYTPTDIVKRFDETLVCDLNKPIEINLKHHETAVFSGVLEYVYNIDHVFEQLYQSNINQVVMSYCCSDIIKSSRKKNGWLSDFKKSELIDVFKKYNYEIIDYQEWKSQSIFNLKLNLQQRV